MSQYSLISLVNAFQDNINEFLYSGNYNISEELGEETRTILKGLEKIKLDANFLETAQKWPKELNSNEISEEQKVVVSLLNQGDSMMREIKNDLNRVSQSTKNNDQMRRDHYNARAKLRAFVESLNPYSYGAFARLENFSHHVGATNRLNFYRNTLTRDQKLDELNAYKTWADKKVLSEAPKFSTPDWRSYANTQTHHKNSTRPHTAVVNNSSNKVSNNSRFVNSLGPKTPKEISDAVFKNNHTGNRIQSAHVNLSNETANESNKNLSEKYLIERGIIPNYPDRSEYSYSYVKPKESEYISSFTINPQPNMSLFGRKFATTVYEPRYTEYQLKFPAPDGNKLERLPWLRKW